MAEAVEIETTAPGCEEVVENFMPLYLYKWNGLLNSRCIQLLLSVILSKHAKTIKDKWGADTEKYRPPISDYRQYSVSSQNKCSHFQG